jgi:hypothetical protein
VNSGAPEGLTVPAPLVQPDVIIGTEIWLTKDTGNGEIFPAELGFRDLVSSYIIHFLVYIWQVEVASK